MAVLDAANCSKNQRNTGLGTCPFNPDLIRYIMAVPKGTTFTAADLADIQTVLQDGFLADAYADRFHLFGAFESIDNQSEDRQQQTLGYGRKVTTRDAQYYFNFQYLDGYMCAHKNNLAFNGRQSEYDWFFIDNANVVWGTTTISAGLTLFKGYDFSEFYEQNFMPKDGSNDTIFMLSVGLANAKQMNQDFHSITLDFNIADLQRVMDVELQQLSAITGTGEVNILLAGGCGADNLVDTYAALVATGNFVVQNAQTGAAITITSVTSGGITPGKYIAFNLDSADTDYPASGDFLSIDLAAPSVLMAVNPAFSFDGVRLLIQVP